MRESEAKKAYFKELGASIAIYMALLFGGNAVARAVPEGAMRTLLMVSPMIGFLLMIWAVARQVRRMDEYMRQVTLESLCIAAAVTAGLSFTYGFLETAGYPRLSMFWVWGVMGGTWGLLAALRCAIKK